MANNRQAIRTAVQAMLLGNTDADQNVYKNRESKLWQSELPSILIYTLQEPSTSESLQSRRYIRDLELLIKVKVEATESVDDVLDALVGEVEDLINADRSLSGTVLSTVQQNTEITIESEGENDVGTAILTFTCKYIS